MSKNSELLDSALLAEAAYANFIANDGITLFTTKDDIKDALTAKDWSSTQAEEFLQRWRVISQQPKNTRGQTTVYF